MHAQYAYYRNHLGHQLTLVSSNSKCLNKAVLFTGKPSEQPGMHLSVPTTETHEEGEEQQSSSETGSGRPSLEEYPSSYFELRPQEACLYTVYDEGTAEESERYKMPLTDEQVDKVAEIYESSNSLEQLLEIVPKVQEYLTEGITTFKVLSAVESDGCRSSFIISSLIRQPSSGTSSSSDSVGSSFDF